MFNQVTLVGNLGKDPEIRYTPSGAKVTSFNVATNHRYTVDGDSREEVDWFNISLWGDRGDPIFQYLKKGSKVLVVGRMHGRAYVPQSGGEPRVSLDMSNPMVRFLDSKEDRPQASEQPGTWNPAKVDVLSDSDLPF